MSNESYVSSEGVVVSVYDEGLSGTGEGPMGIEIGSALDVALATHYQQRRDKDLGRWRNPEKPNEVVYPFGEAEVRVIDEAGGRRVGWTRAEVLSGAFEGDLGFATARAYFEPHPPEPKPWHEAKEGEVWVLARWGTEEPYLVEGDEFLSLDLAVIVDLDSGSITAGRRIWPEGEEN